MSWGMYELIFKSSFTCPFAGPVFLILQQNFIPSFLSLLFPVVWNIDIYKSAATVEGFYGQMDNSWESFLNVSFVVFVNHFDNKFVLAKVEHGIHLKKVQCQFQHSDIFSASLHHSKNADILFGNLYLRVQWSTGMRAFPLLCTLPQRRRTTWHVLRPVGWVLQSLKSSGLAARVHCFVEQINGNE